MTIHRKFDSSTINRLVITTNGKNQPLVGDEPVEFEIKPVEIEDFKKITHHFRGMYGIYPHVIKKTPKEHNMHSVRLDNTRLSTDCALKPPRTPAYESQRFMRGFFSG